MKPSEIISNLAEYKRAIQLHLEAALAYAEGFSSRTPEEQEAHERQVSQQYGDTKRAMQDTGDRLWQSTLPEAEALADLLRSLETGEKVIVPRDVLRRALEDHQETHFDLDGREWEACCSCHEPMPGMHVHGCPAGELRYYALRKEAED